MVLIIPASKGYTTQIDECDLDLVTGYKVYAQLKKEGGAYIVLDRWSTRERYYLHRRILERVLGRPLTEGEQVDHEDLDKTNNTRRNLRLASGSNNEHNRGVPRNSTTGFKGVTWSEKRQRYLSRIAVGRTRIHLGWYVDAVDAAKAYNEAAVIYHGEFARLNIIKE